jgi:hypothetical protein
LKNSNQFLYGFSTFSTGLGAVAGQHEAQFAATAAPNAFLKEYRTLQRIASMI